MRSAVGRAAIVTALVCIGLPLGSADAVPDSPVQDLPTFVVSAAVDSEAVLAASATSALMSESVAATSSQLKVGKGTSVANFTVAKGSYRDAAGHVVTLASASTWTCRGTTDNPHYSSGANGVIAKTKVTCTGPNAALNIRVHQLLGRTTSNSVSSLKIVAESNYVQAVTANYGLGTWYVPELGKAGAKRNAYFRASHSSAAAPPFITIGSYGVGASTFLKVK